MEKPVSQMSLTELCTYHMQYNFSQPKSIRVVLELIDKNMKECEELLHDLENAGLQHGESWDWTLTDMGIYEKYRAWAERRLQELQ